MSKTYRYKAVCHTTTYWLDTLWKPGDIYEGELVPSKHFSAEGQPKPELPPDDAGMDPRSNRQLKLELEKRGFKAPSNWKRKQLWGKLRDIDLAESKDELTNPTEKRGPGRPKAITE